MICIFSQPPSYVQKYRPSDVCSLTIRQSHIYLPTPNDWWTTGRSEHQAAKSGKRTADSGLTLPVPPLFLLLQTFSPCR